MVNEALYNALLQSIKLNEMARFSVSQRTIDRNVWLSVASTCSRNKTSEAQFIKPLSKLSKEDLVIRYVTALLVMKKPCPQTEDDIEDLKTFKLFAKKALELGATMEDIQNLYNENSGGSTTPITKKETTPVIEPVKKEKVKAEISVADNVIYDLFKTVEKKCNKFSHVLFKKLMTFMVQERIDKGLFRLVFNRLNNMSDNMFYIQNIEDGYIVSKKGLSTESFSIKEVIDMDNEHLLFKVTITNEGDVQTYTMGWHRWKAWSDMTEPYWVPLQDCVEYSIKCIQHIIHS